MKSTITTINYHVCKACNMKCRYCYAGFKDIKKDSLTATSSFQLLKKLAHSGMFYKINFAGGEPLLIPFLPELLKTAKDLGFITSVVTNGSLLNNKWIDGVSNYLDILALSVDSSCEQINYSIGRASHGQPITKENYIVMASYVENAGVKLKINTVVNSMNKNENMTALINSMDPFRWKIMQTTMVKGQNDHNYYSMSISDAEFKNYIVLNKAGLRRSIELVPEKSEITHGSYLMIDPSGRFFDSSTGQHNYSEPILRVGVENALNQVSVSREKFIIRKGEYLLNK